MRRLFVLLVAVTLALPGSGLASGYVLKRERTLAMATPSGPTRTAVVILFNFADDARRLIRLQSRTTSDTLQHRDRTGRRIH
jgi:hypothetical protein